MPDINHYWMWLQSSLLAHSLSSQNVFVGLTLSSSMISFLKRRCDRFPDQECSRIEIGVYYALKTLETYEVFQESYHHLPTPGIS